MKLNTIHAFAFNHSVVQDTSDRKQVIRCATQHQVRAHIHLPLHLLPPSYVRCPNPVSSSLLSTSCPSHLPQSTSLTTIGLNLTNPPQVSTSPCFPITKACAIPINQSHSPTQMKTSTATVYDAITTSGYVIDCLIVHVNTFNASTRARNNVHDFYTGLSTRQ